MPSVPRSTWNAAAGRGSALFGLEVHYIQSRSRHESQANNAAHRVLTKMRELADTVAEVAKVQASPEHERIERQIAEKMAQSQPAA